MASVITPRHAAVAEVPPRQSVVMVQSVTSESGATHQDSPRAAYRVRPGDSLWRIAESKLGSGERWREIFEHLSARTGRKKAIVAVARRLLGVMMALLKSGQPYRHAYAPAEAAANA